MPSAKLLPIFKQLSFYTLLAILLAIAFGHYFPKLSLKLNVISNWFIQLVKLFIAPIIFLTITTGMLGFNNLKKVGSIGLKSILYFEIVTTFALAIGMLVALIFRPGAVNINLLPTNSTTQNFNNQTKINWLNFLKDNFTLQVLLVSIVVGVGLHFFKQKQSISNSLHKALYWVFKLLHWLMYTAPLAAFCGMAYTIGKFGLKSIIPLAKLMICMYGTCIVFVVFILGLILKYFKQNIFSFLKLIKEEILLVIGTSSSESALPTLMQKLQKMGCSKTVVGLVVPTGYSFNLDGTSIYLSMAVIFLAQLYGVQLSFQELVFILLLLMLTSKGAAGVTGSGFVILASTLTALHKIPVEGLVYIFGIDKFMSEARAITNLIGNGVATIVIAKSENEFETRS